MTVRQPALQALLAGISRDATRIGRPVRLMEVCGTHTMTAFRSGLHSLLPENVSLVAGPGCPVCVTPPGFVDAAVSLAHRPGIILATYGDLLRVRGSETSLEQERARGSRVEVIYSPSDALVLAGQNPESTVVLLGVGFETTAPGAAQTLRTAKNKAISNFLVLSAHKTMPRAMKALTSDGKARIDGFLCPGHVSVVIGASAFAFLATDRHVPCVIAGFEPLDLLEAIAMLLGQLAEGRSSVEIQYRRAVTWEGNRRAQAAIAEVFEACDSPWRGLGSIPGSGLSIRAAYASHDAAVRLDIRIGRGRETPGCRCSDVLRGYIRPSECRLYCRECTPRSPQGACMVSSEGACAASARYELNGRNE
jgi:hydrogenase expression/formation protein HypD